MTHKIVRTAQGKETVVAEGSLSKMNDRLRQLRSSTQRGVSGRGGKKYQAIFRLEKT